jgi:proteasome lid subunit RPN8/RPN11
VRTLTVLPPLRAELERVAWEHYPNEACALLIGTADQSAIRVAEVIHARNAHPTRARNRYEVAPEDLIRAHREAESRGLELVGIWHSHPDRPACPSSTDRASAASGWSYMITSVTRCGVLQLRSWRLQDGELREEALEPSALPVHPNATAQRATTEETEEETP